ncbi:efflux RND transporter periplasmic adaptor subunit [Aureibacter tunicatorum]|uniref:Membrane fusion protein (Multidrug efflux system) n=1 Tax=Aureibacter tunicatorum TaxID=866807 RepID=A0AAE4BUV8_9BACT|nr:efflux RND transporter periplasmic adaptor subunit [Aureibacter tunicatorum]MDR6241168.1 membrane fusion protein (multidrug efflux system) [Aureibacter tunicatorum]BDD03943.1 hemolysin D [Aureibacter tunicatorum]
MIKFKQLLLIAWLVHVFLACQSTHTQINRDNSLALETQTLTTSAIRLEQNYVASIEGVKTIEIRPQTSGFIERCNIIEGQEVKKGEVLFTINSENQRQAVRAAEALKLVAEANVENAELEVLKVKPLVTKGIIGEVELATVKSNRSAAVAQLEKAKADLKNAKENLSYTIVRSPVDGVVGDLPYKLGSLVSSQTPLPLTTISDISEMNAFFTLTEKELLRFLRDTKELNHEQRLNKLPDVTLMLADGSTFEHSGKVVAINGLVNPRTGSVSFKAAFPNPDQLMRSGSSGTIKMPLVLDNALLIPKSATFELQGKLFVYLLNEERKAVSKEIKVSSNQYEDRFIVEAGVQINDEIVAEGLIKVREGVLIQ